MIDEAHTPPDCGSPEHSAPWTRRRLLGAGSALGGLAWLNPAARRLARAAEKGARPRSLVVLWMEGGLSQLDSFDPHPDSPIAYGARAIATAAKGIRFGEGLPQLAELAEDFAVVRSVTSKEGDHARATYNAKTGYRPVPKLVHPAIGAVVCHELDGPGGPATDLPSHISILAGGFPARGGYLGAKFDAFQTGDPAAPLPDLRAYASADREQRRFESLDLLERGFAAGRLESLEESRTLHRTSLERARTLMGSAQLAAFDVGAAPKAERDGYGDTPFGRGCLAAVRLVEAGVRCVEVTLRGWDTHLDNATGQARQLAALDPALASLFRGLKDRGLLDDTLVLVATEFGRTPKLNATEGRDHWPHGFSVLVGGGGIRGGIAVGETDPSGEAREPSREVRVEDLHATLLTRLGIDPSFEMATPIGRPVAFSEGRLVRELL
jgi:uncharacterized protein (DUF1501 family)